MHRLLTKTVALTMSAAITSDFVFGGYGAAYGVSSYDRARLVLQSRRIVRSLPSGTSALVHLLLMREVLSIPPNVPGVVVECGVWKGASSASLSLACHLTQRRLLVCDSFAGLPATEQHLYLAPHSGIYGYLQEGMFSGSLPEVERNLARFGQLAVCDFVPGFFADSLRQLAQPVVFAFLDVDLPTSFQSCLRALWPRLHEEGLIYVDDIGCLDVARLFFDEDWWQRELQCPAPGLVGAGCGLPIHPTYSNIGYVRKSAQHLPSVENGRWQRDPDLAYPDQPKEPG